MLNVSWTILEIKDIIRNQAKSEKKKEIKERNESDMGKGMRPKMGYNDKKYKANYDNIDWSFTRKNRQGLMNSSTQVHSDKRQKDTDKRHQREIDEI